MRDIAYYLNPISRLGNKRYSISFSFFTLLIITILSEFFVYSIAHNPMLVGSYIIFLHVCLIIYFSFRDGIKGGAVASFMAVGYYFYIIYTRHYHGAPLTSGIETTIVLGLSYLGIAGVIGWLKQTIDILIESEADEKRRLQTIIDQLPVGVVITNKDGEIIQANKKIDTIMGFKFPVGFKVGQETLLTMTEKGKTVSAEDGPLAQILTSGKAVVDRDYIVTRKDGKQMYLQVSAVPIYNKEGKLIAVASITNDVTVQRELENRKDDFVNMASHELKTPITSMKLYIESFLRKSMPIDQERAVKIISRLQYQTEKLQELVTDLLDVSRIQTGKMVFKKEDFNINELIQETVQGLQETAQTTKMTFSATKSLQVYGDRFRLYQVLTNLLTNAIKYSQEGGVIKVTLSNSHDKATISVKDTGIGIPKVQQKKIFDRLYQVTDPKEKTFPGLGMGLYISREIIKRHRGSIWVESEKDKGSTFYFSLPLKRK